MYLTNQEFNTIKRALELLPHGNSFIKLSKKKQDIIISADDTMVKLLQKQKANNKKTAQYIAEKKEKQIKTMQEAKGIYDD